MKEVNLKNIDNRLSLNKSKNIYLFIIILLIIFCTFMSVSFYKYKHSHNHLLKNNPYPFIDPARNFIPQEDFIVNIQPLREDLNNFVKEKKLSDKVSIYFEIINTGANISINPEKKIFPASLTKLPLAIAAVKKIENGVWDWEDKITLEEGDLDQNSGYLYERGVGATLSIEELIKELLINSDNTAYRALLRNVETINLTNMVSSLGLEDLFTDGGKMSAKEYTRFFRSLYTSSYLKRENSNKILTLLSESQFNDYLKHGISKDIKFAHKIGENHLYNSYSDAGIVYLDNRAYMLSVMYEVENGENEKEQVSFFMKELSKRIYDYVSSQ